MLNLCLRCSACGRTYSIDSRVWHCSCGSPFELEGTPLSSRDRVKVDEPTLWRYRAALPLEDNGNLISLGEGFTPLVKTEIYGLSIHCKLEFLAPTGSFKDRGTTVLVSALQEMEIKDVVEDSSGNAAASLAAYCARAKLHSRIYIPAHASPAKRAQILVYGAELVSVEGPREQAAVAAREAAKEAYYASHYYNPLVLEGLKTFAYETCEQLDWHAPHNVVFPVGHGTLLLGTYRGFVDLAEAGVIERLPRLFGIQARACAPLYEAYRRGLDDAPPIRGEKTIAEGICIAKVVRGRQVLQAIRKTGGAVLAVDDEATRQAQGLLAQQGLYVEPTSAVAIAGLQELAQVIAPGEVTVVPLTGSGLKSLAREL